MGELKNAFMEDSKNVKRLRELKKIKARTTCPGYRTIKKLNRYLVKNLHINGVQSFFTLL